MKTQTGKSKDGYKKLTGNMVLFVVAVSLFPLILSGAATLADFKVAYRAKISDHLRELVQKHSQNIDGFLENRLGDLRVVARSYTLAELSDVQFLRNRLQILRDEYKNVYVDLGLVHNTGTQISYAGPFDLLMADYSDAPWFKNTLKSDYYISEVFTGFRGSPHFIVAVKINSDNICYILKATIDFEAFNALVENIKIGRTGFAFILNREGRFQTKPRNEVVLNRGPYFDLLEGRINPGNVPVLERTNAFGRKSIFAMAPLKNEQWILCLQQEASDAYAYMNATVKLALTIIVISATIVVILALTLSRRLVGRFIEVDEEKAAIQEMVIETGRLASIGELAAGIAHEINNPVAIMVEEAGWVEDLLGDNNEVSEESLAEMMRAVRQIRTQGARCKDITYKLLSFARKTDPTPKNISLNELVEEMVGLLSQKSRFATVQVKTELAPDLPPVSASPSEMQQVILNLMNNAVDAVGAGGGVVTVATHTEDDRVHLTVADTGKGIPEAYLERIFDPFFTTKPVGSGTGLGLSICYGIVDKIGGKISVRSQTGQGTTFTITLPVSKRPDNESGESERPAPSL